MEENKEYMKDDSIEKEANIFAVCLLIPKDLLLKELERKPLDLGDDTRLKELCKLFGVTTAAMTFRMSLLKKI
jgi:Zn-dependent peptidase ImmA (M78 family)